MNYTIELTMRTFNRSATATKLFLFPLVCLVALLLHAGLFACLGLGISLFAPGGLTLFMGLMSYLLLGSLIPALLLWESSRHSREIRAIPGLPAEAQAESHLHGGKDYDFSYSV